MCAGAVNAAPNKGKSIHLRNETITPEPIVSNDLSVAAAASEARSGLFLIQFTNTIQPAWREELRVLGVDLLFYVPDDAFVARFDRVPLGQVRHLGYVRWIGNYRAEHKIGRQLLPGGTHSYGDSTAVAVLLSPRATQADVAKAKGSLNFIRQEGLNRFGRVLRGDLNLAQLNAFAASDSVLWIEPAPDMKLFDEVSARIVGGDGPPGQTLVQSLGFTGAGVTVAVPDSGLDSGNTNSMHPDIAGRVSALFHYGTPGQLQDASDEHSHGTHVAGIIAGNGAVGEQDANGFLYGLGVAPGSRLVGQRIFDAVGNYAPPPSFETLTRDARRAGAEIGSNSWGDDTQGRYDISAMEFDALVRDADELALGDQPFILEFSAGNAGPAAQTIGSPAVAKNVIASGAANSDRRNLPIEEFTIYDTGPETMADFSSRGPCEDGRIKPDVVAPGSWIASLRSVFANDDYAWWPISSRYLYQGGTSQSGPHVSGAAAVFVQFYRTNHGTTPSPALVKAALINSATDMDDAVETGPAPNNDEGWGRVNLPALVAGQRNHDFVDQTVLLTNGGVYEKRILIGSANEPLKITLTYTDVPGNPAAVIALVNDLDLEVVSPDGHLYRGNRFDFGESVPDAAGSDAINNVEGVHLLAPVPGEYLIRIRGTRVVEDARRDTGTIDQDFALVASGAFGTPGVGIVTFSQPAYRAPDQIHLVLVDYDLAGQPTRSLLVRSGAEPGGETVSLFARGTTGTFTGVVATATGPAVTDGKLQLAHGNLIEAVYADAAPAANRVFTARADLQPPVISNVRATNRFGQVLISWTTDEDAKSIVYYGSNTPTLGLTNVFPDTTHEFALVNLPANAVIRFMAVGEDPAGNRSTNDNNGLFFSITNTQPPSVLLVDGYTDNGGLVAAPPLSGYTDALNALGVAYSVFDATTGLEPSLTQLQAHRCVIWRMDEISAPTASLGQKIASYVNSGGALLIASMEGVTRLTEAGLASFNTNILQIQSYLEDQPVDNVLGSPGDPVGAGLDTALDYSPYDELLLLLQFLGVNDPPDWITPTTNAAPILLANGSIVGVRSPKTGVDLRGRVVYLSFPLDAVPLGSSPGNNRLGLLRNILNFLAPQPGSSSLALDRDVYSVPGRAIVEVEDADLQGVGQVNVTFASPLQTNGIALLETERKGLFRGSIIFASTNSGLPGTLRVQANNTVEARYFDASAARTLLTTATIETNAPVISGVFIEPGYLEAIVSWDTSEAADALVQYGESPDSFPINFTAYDPTLGTYHELFLSGLQPNTTYYVRIFSRDRAGNTAVDDNNGQFYKFTTLQPLQPPWHDNMETNSAAWSTYAATDSESDWTRGAPGNGETANSLTNCWGSNLDGGPLSLAECYLISPGILLTGGNRATLRFWHNYDFFPQSEFDLLEGGQLEILTNVTTAPVPVAAFQGDASFGWEEVELDLSPYLGNVVYVVWHYVLLSFDSLPRLGWLVDDASVTVDTIVPSTVQITNNLWQAVFALSGPTARSGRGQWTVITNAAPGQYKLTFGDVAYYNTPAPQTNNLPPGGTITFTGNYTFADVNTNGIPDGWETANFGGVTTNVTRLTDADGDGLTDYAEFVTGTNPTNANSVLELTPTLVGSGAVTLQWPSATGHGYRVLGSDNLTTWSPVTAWIRASSGSLTTNLPASSARRYFRVEAQP